MESALAELPVSGIDRVLDFGCGSMPYRRLFEDRWPHLSYHGADLPGNPQAAISVSEAGILAAGRDSFDLVLSTQVLEHVPEPEQYLNEAARVLRADGYLLLSTHGFWKYHPDPTDYWRWTGDGLRKIISDAGFEVVSIRGVGNLGAAAVQLFQDAVIHAMPSFLTRAFVLAAQFMEGVMCRLAGGDSSQDAMVFVVTARRVRD